MAFDLVQAFATAESPFFLAGTNYTAATLTEAPQQLALRFSAGVKVDPASVAGAITVTRSNGLGDAFSNGNDIVVTPGYIGVDDAPNENRVIIRFAETLPNDSYRITIGASLKTLAEGSAPVQMFRDGGSFNLNFRLDLGAQVTAVVPQPVIRAKTIQFSALPQDGDLLEVGIRGGRRVFEFEGGGGVRSGNTAITLTGKTTATLAADVAAAINALSTETGFPGELGTASVADATVSVSGINFTPVIGFSRGGTVPANSPVRVGDGALSQLASKVVVYFNAADPLEGASVVPDAFKLFTLDSATGADTATVTSPTAVSYDAASASAVLTFATDLAADKLYRLQIGQSAVTPNADVAEADNANSTFASAKDLGSLSGRPLERISVKVTGSISQTAPISTPAGNLVFPRPTGDGSEPGHRDIPHEHHLDGASVAPGPIRVQEYNFNDYYGDDVQGNRLTNVITETQKQRAREIFDLYSRYTGIRFVETADQGITVITGDLRAFSSTIPREPVAGLAGFASYAAMDSGDDWGESEYGGSWFEVAMHEIGHALGLGHSYDIPSIMGNHYGPRLNLGAEPVFPGNYDAVHLDVLYPRAGTDIDLYKFNVAVAGQLTAQTFVSRAGQPVLSKLDSVLSLYREAADKRELIARNDDYFGRDSFVGLALEPGTYYVAVTSTGNTNFNPDIPDSGYGGRTDGAYELRLDFSPAASVTSPLKDSTGTPLDGDRDGKAGGEYKFWFQTAAATLFVDKAAYTNFGASQAAGADGTLAKPFYRIQDAITAAAPGSIIRIIGNTGNAAAATDDRPYLIGIDPYDRVLEDGESFIVPKDVAVMIDAGVTLKLRAANIDVGSSSSLVDRSGATLQVLGTPSEKVFFTSFHDDARGGDSDRFGPAVQGGQWGGLVFRGDSDFNKDRVLGTLGTSQNNDTVFLNSVSNASLRYGGGPVVVNGYQQNYAPLHLESTRPSLVFNDVTDSLGAPISADPNSFEDTAGRVGPEIRGNRLVDNSINGIFVRIHTELGKSIDKLNVPARFRNTDAPYVLTENLHIDGGAGGYVEIDDGDPDTNDTFTRDAGRLQVDPGVVIKLWRSRIELDRGRAQFIAEGMPNSRIVFTTLADNRFGGGGTFDTNGMNLDVRTVGDWGGIIVNAGAKASIDQAYIAFGGGETPIEGRFDNFSVVETHQGDLRLTNSRIENNAASIAESDRDGRGRNAAATVFVRGAQPIIVGNDFRSNAGAMVSINANSLVEAENPDSGRSTGPIDRFTGYDDNRGPLVRGNTTSYSAGSGAIAGMRVRGEEITVESVWDDTEVVHVLQDEIIVQNFHTATGVRLQSSPDASLVVKLLGPNAGFTAAGYGLDIDDRIGGTVQVVGFPTKPVILTSLNDDSIGVSYDALGRLVTDTNGNGATTTAAAGDWRSLKFLPLSNDRNVAVVNEAEAAYRGSSTTDPNGRIAAAQVLGVLAPNFATGSNTWESAQEKTGDENRRLGFEVHGTIALDNTGDNDVYAFQGYSGSEVWFDIDKTSPALDAMLELLDASGSVIARSADAARDGDLPQAVIGAALPLTKDTWRGGDYYGTNPRDPGMRVILPTRAGYPLGTLTQYYVRVRSQAAYGPTTAKADYENGLTATTPPALIAGASKGEYELRIRLRQRDEKPGSTVRSADIRFPTTGIEVLGLPHNSQVLGETAEANVDANGVWTSAEKVGNLLAFDRNTISIGGELSSATDIDWFQFDLDIQQIQSIGGLNNGGKTWSMVFDLDYADGFRGDLTVSVFDKDGKLIFVGRDSDVAADQPGVDPITGQLNQGNDFDDLSRGSIGKLDPFIGPIQMPATAGRYYVAVSSNEQLPLALNATFRSDAANAQIRLEPVNSLDRIVEDHIGSIGYKDSAKQQINPTSTDPLIDISSTISLAAHVTPFTLGDVTLFLSNAGGLFTHDAVSGLRETTISTAFGGLTIGDIDIRPDGKLYAYAGVSGDPTTVGQLMELDSGNGSTIAISPDGIPNSDGAPPPNFQTTSDTVTAMTFGRTAPGAYKDLWLVVASGNQSKLYLAADGGSATTAADATANQGKDSAFGYKGRIGIDFNGDGDFSDAGERPQVTGLQYIDDASGTLYGVTLDGKLLRITPGAKSADEAIDFDARATVVADYGPDLAKVGATGFTAVATAPQNLYDGTLKGKFFALTNTGRLVLINPTASSNKAATLNGTAGLLQRTGDTGGSIFLTGSTSGVVSTKATTSGAVVLSGTTSGTTFTASGALPNSIRPDMLVAGPGVPYNTTVSSLVGSVVTLSQPVSFDVTTADTFSFLQPLSPPRAVISMVNPPDPVTLASATVGLDNASDIEVGMLAINDRLPAYTIVTAVDLTRGDVTLSNTYFPSLPGSPRILFVRPDRTELGTLSVGSNTITGITTGNLRSGMAVFGDGVPNGAWVTNVLGTRIELSAPTTAGGQKTLYFVDGRSVFGIVNTSQIRPGMVVEAGPNIAPNTFVTAVNATGIVLSQGATGTARLADLRFFQPVVANVSGTAAGTSVTIATTALEVGMVAVGPGVPANTRIDTLGSGALTLNNAIPTGSVSLTFYRDNDGTPVLLSTPANLSTAGITTGMLVFGPGIASNTTVVGLNPTTKILSLSKPALETIDLNTLRLVAPATSRAAAITAGQAVLSVSTTAGIAVDMVAVADGVPAGALVTAVDSTAKTITLSQPATQTSGNVTVRFIRPDIVRNGTGDPFDSNAATLTIATTNLHVGMLVFGNGVPAGTVVTAKTASTLTLSNAIAAGAGNYAFVRDGRVVSNISGMTNLAVGQAVTGTAIPAGVTVAAVNAADRQITLSQSVTAATSSNTLTFAGPGVTNAIIGGLSSTANLSVGMSVIGNDIPAGVTIASIDDYRGITLSASLASAGARDLIFVTAGQLASPIVKRDGTTTDDSAIVTLENVADLRVGMLVQGAGIATNSVIVSRDVTAKTITLSAAATGADTTSLDFINTSSLDYLADWSSDYNFSPVLAAGATGIAFSPLDVNLWHPTERRGDKDNDSVTAPDPGHGINSAPDNSRGAVAGGTSMYFGLETWKASKAAYTVFSGQAGQYGVTADDWQRELTTNTGLGDTYDLPGGAYGSLTTNAFSLAGYSYTNKPTLYFTYWLDTQDATAAEETAQDAARVSISKDGGATWEVIASNKKTDLPGFPSVSSKISGDPLQLVQELFDSSKTTGWRQARIDIGNYADEASLRLRFDFTSGAITAPERGQNNNFEGFYIDDIMVGFAERGEMVTGAVAGQAAFFGVGTPAPDATVPAQYLQGPYQLEMRRGTEYAANVSAAEADIAILRTFDTDDDLIRSGELLGDENLPREQGQFIIEGNWIANAQAYGISIDAGERDPATGVPASGAPRKLPTLNNSRLALGAVVVNNINSSSGVAGILFSGDANSGNGPLAAVPYGRIVNNTIYGGATQTGVGVLVTENAAPTLLNNVFSGFTTAIDVDTTSVNDGLGNLRTVIGTSAFHNVGTQVRGTTASQSLTLTGNPFVAAGFANFYLAEGTRAIDSSLNTLQDRTEYNVVTSPLGIAVSPIVAPDRDIYGQLRGDDPKMASTPGLGSNIFKDRGAVDRVDFTSPFRTLVIPADSVRAVAVVRDDLENSLTASGAAGRGITRLELRLSDRGVGIDPATVRPEAFLLQRGSNQLVAGRDYLYSFDPTKNTVTFEAVTVFAPDRYTLSATSQKAAAQPGLLTDLANNTLRPNNDDGTLTFAITLSHTPDSPADVTGVAGDTTASLSWTAPAANGSPIEGYVIEYSTTGTGGWTLFTRPALESPTSAATTVTGLANGQGYWFRVAAKNSNGDGPWSDVIGPITPAKVLTLTLATDTGMSSSDGVTNNGQINVGSLSDGATWEYRTNSNGSWTQGTDSSFTLPTGTYAIGSVEVRQLVGGVVTGVGSNAVAITVDTLAPTITAFSSSTPNGTYKAGDAINITATISEAVQAGATITVTLDTGATVTLTRATATTLTGTYTVAAGHNTADLTVTSLTAGTVLDIAGNQLTSTTVPTSANNIAGLKDIVVDAVAPTIISFSSTTANGTYKPGDSINITATTSEAIQANATITVTLDTGAMVTLRRDTATTLTGTYSVVTGRNTTDLTVTAFTAGTVFDIAGNKLTSTAVPTGVNNIAGSKDIGVDGGAPTIISFSSTSADGRYRSGSRINITATTSEEIQGGATITATLNTGAIVTLARATGTTLTGTYTVAAGHNTADLTVTSFTAGNVLDTTGNQLTSTTLPMGTNNIGGSRNIVIDTIAPTITAFSSSTPNGSYNDGGQITLVATTSEAVRATATITVTLNTGATVTLTRATATTLTGTYTVAAGHNTADLAVTSFTTGTVLDGAGNRLTSTTVPTGANNIAGPKDIVIDTFAPTITVFASTTANGAYRAGSRINITATTSEEIQVGATFTVTLNTGATVTLSQATGTTLTGVYTVAAGHNTADLTVTSFTAGTVLDTAGNRLTSTALPVGTNNISGSKDIVIDTVQPSVLRVTTTTPNGNYAVGTNIVVQVAFAETVFVTGTPVIALNTAPARNAIYTSGSGTALLQFTYVVAGGDSSPDLNYTSTAAMTGGTIRDAAGNNTVRRLPAVTAAGSLGGTREIVIDGVIRAAVFGFGGSPDGPVFTSPVKTVPVTFNSPVTGLTVNAFRLFYEGRSVSLQGATVSGSGTSWTLSLPTTATSLRGRYRLDLVGPGSGIQSGGVAMTTSLSIYWQRV